MLTAARTPVRQLASATWHARGLIMILARKDFYVRYRRASFGMAWAIAIPLIQAVVLAFVVSRIARFPTGSDYVVYVLSGTVAWATFATVVAGGSTAIVDGSSLSTKIYFPRMVLPLVTVATAAYGLLFSVLSLLAAALLTGAGLGLRTLLLLPAMLLVLVLSAAFAIVLSALHVYFRDVRYIVQAALLAWLYLTPVIYRLEWIGGARRFVMANPMTGVVELFRAAAVGADPGWLPSLLATGGWCIALLATGLLLHRRFDRVFVDLL